MTKPLLYRAQVNSGPQAARGERGTEFVKPEVAFVQAGAFSNSLQAVEEIQLVRGSD
jgi:hypothetical protein